MKRSGIILVLILCNLSILQGADFRLASIFGSNMVLQQQTEVTIWGNGLPKSTIAISGSWGEKSSAICKTDSSWSTKLKTPMAGGPFTVTINAGNSEQTLENVLIGEVWLCSGQSNMEMPLRGWPPKDLILNSFEEIRQANYPGLRFYTVEKTISFYPKKTCQGEWLECSPESAENFSATAFFFGKKLYEELNVPVGLIHSSWGGTPVEAWTSRKYLEKRDDFFETFKTIENSLPVMKELNSWLLQFPVAEIKIQDGADSWEKVDFQDNQCLDISYDDSKWRMIELPELWENTEVGAFDGVVWFRKVVNIPGSWVGKELEIQLGPIDDFDRTYVNGKLVGAIEEDGNWQTKRIYKISPFVNNSTSMAIAIRVIDNRGGGGIYGQPDDMKLVLKESGEMLSIKGIWKYLPVAEYKNGQYFVFGAEGEKYHTRPFVPMELNSHTPTVLYNGMIAPLIPFTLKGAIWYQGESNVDRPTQYESLFPLMITNWRNDWRSKFPFYFVQIAPYNYGEKSHSELLRDAQRKTLSFPNTGMAVTLDIGVNDNIHPDNKTDVGNRLAYWALAKQYGKNITFSGPIYKSHMIKKNKMIIQFDYADGMSLKTGVVKEVLIAGEDRVFYPAEVKIVNNELIVSSKKVKSPVAVRYAWSNTASASLFNATGLPASSFRTDNW